MLVNEDIVFAFDAFHNHIFLASALAFDEAKGCFGPITFRVFGDFKGWPFCLGRYILTALSQAMDLNCQTAWCSIGAEALVS